MSFPPLSSLSPPGCVRVTEWTPHSPIPRGEAAGKHSPTALFSARGAMGIGVHAEPSEVGRTSSLLSYWEVRSPPPETAPWSAAGQCWLSTRKGSPPGRAPPLRVFSCLHTVGAPEAPANGQFHRSSLVVCWAAYLLGVTSWDLLSGCPRQVSSAPEAPFFQLLGPAVSVTSRTANLRAG